MRRSSATAAAIPSSPRAQIVTLQPSASKAFAEANPNPRVEPVTMAILFVSSRSMCGSELIYLVIRRSCDWNYENPPAPPALPALLSNPFVQEPPKRVVEGRRLFHVGHVPRSLNHHEL